METKTNYQRAQRKYDRAKAILKPIFVPFRHSIIIKGLENILESGPNLIVANHPGIGRDVAGVCLTYRRRLYFLAAHYLFDESELLLKHIKPALGEVLFRILYPIARKFASYLSRQMQELEMIPINKEYQNDRRKLVTNLREALNKVKEFLTKGRAVVIFPIRYNLLNTIGRKSIVSREPSKYNPYIPQLSSTIAKIIFELWREHGLNIPVTPIAIARAEGLNPFRRMRVNIGAPLTIQECLAKCQNVNPVTYFTDLLERYMSELLEFTSPDIAEVHSK